MAFLDENAISGNSFPQVYEKGNISMIFEEIVDHRVNGTYTPHQDYFIVSNNGVNRIREAIKESEILIK